MQVEPVQSKNNSWRHVPDRVKCFVSSSTEAPSVVPANSIRVSQMVLANSSLIQLNLSWSPPLKQNGRIVQYHIKITEDSSIVKAPPLNRTGYTYQRLIETVQ